MLCPIFGFTQDTLFNKTISEVTIRSTGKKSTEAAVINIIRNNSAVSDGISIDFIKKTPDRTASDALKRISGVTIQNDKFVLVRGLADRYNLAMLNKTLLPSTEPDRRSFSFDIIPSNLIDNIVVNKSSTSNLPGDFAGGLIQVSTKEVSNKFLNLSLGSGYGLISTNKNFQLVDYVSFPSNFPSTYKFRISGNGDKRAYTKLISSPIAKELTSTLNTNGALSFGVKKNNWNVLFSSTARNSYSLNSCFHCETCKFPRYFNGDSRFQHKSPEEQKKIMETYLKNFLEWIENNYSQILEKSIKNKELLKLSKELNYKKFYELFDNSQLFNMVNINSYEFIVMIVSRI